MNSLGLQLFHRLCEIGNGLEYVRDRHAPGSDDWTMLTEMLGWLDGAVDMLVLSSGLEGEGEGDA